MIPSPKLDDRGYDDLVAEAIRLIPRYAPEWTHHNPSDPGITLIELAAWMTDLTLYRLNRRVVTSIAAHATIRYEMVQTIPAMMQSGLSMSVNWILLAPGFSAPVAPSNRRIRVKDESTV